MSNSMGDTMNLIFSRQTVDDPAIYVDRLGNLQFCMEINERTECVIQRTKFGMLSILTRSEENPKQFKETFNGNEVDAVRYIAAFILYGFK